MLIKIRKTSTQTIRWFSLPRVYAIIKLETYLFSHHLLFVVECWEWWSFIRLLFLPFCVLVPKLPFDALYWLFQLNNRFHCYYNVDKKMVGTAIGSFNIQHEHEDCINKVNEFILFNICCKSTFELNSQHFLTHKTLFITWINIQQTL